MAKACFQKKIDGYETPALVVFVWDCGSARVSQARRSPAFFEFVRDSA